MQIGRLQIFTDEPEITSENIIRVLRKALPKHFVNARRCEYLLNFEAGIQPKFGEKQFRKDIDFWCIDNLAHKVTEFKLGFNWGSAISLVQRGKEDSGKENESSAVALLNECYESAKIRTKTQQLARFIEICGIGYSYIDINTEYTDGDSYFTVDVLDPTCAFVVRTTYYPDHRIVLGVSFREDELGNRYFTCFTKDKRYEISSAMKIENGKPKKDEKGKAIEEWFENERSGEDNPLRLIPIIEWFRSYDRMGCFEHQIPAMNDLNLLRSNFMNDVHQNTNSLWHYNDVDFPVDENGNEINPKTGEIVRTFTSKDGKTATIKPLTLDYNYQGMLDKMIYDRAIILEECDVPQRSENSANSTGIATSDATGWSGAETAASKEQGIIEDCKSEEVRVALAAIKKSPYTPEDSPLFELRYSDVQASIKRQKNYELTVKANYMATLLSHGFYGEHVIKAANAFDDPNQVWVDSRPLIEAYQKSLFEKSSSNNSSIGEGGEGEKKPNADRLSQDNSDQVNNSPMIDSSRA